jgi:two-component system, LytTR family, sensor kinase
MRRRAWLLYVLAWLPFAGAWGVLVWLSRQSAGFALVASVSMMGAAALLATRVWQASGRHPWPDRGAAGRARFLARHVLQALAFALALIGLDAVLGGSFENRSTLDFLRNEPLWVRWQLLIYSWLYGLVAGVAHAVRAHERLRQSELAAARAETLAAEAQLRALRAQLDPHFLFNALHSLAALVRHDTLAAEEALERLGDLLRYLLDEGAGDTVALADEWNFVRNYLALESLRLGSRLRVESDLDEDALECVVPSFVLQPLVENAVRHAIAPRPEGGVVAISAHLDGSRLRIRVRDDGPGSTREAAETAPGLGLRALRQRIAVRGAEAPGLEIATAPGAGFVATVTLPAGVGAAS